MRNSLAGVRVIELAQALAAPYGGMILADLGAEVIKVEPPGRGEDGRRMGAPFRGGDALVFRDINRGKRSVALDLKSEADRTELKTLLATADILLCNMRPGVLERLGLGAETLRASHPGLIYCDLSAFGHVGPLRLRPGYEPLLQAFSGLASINGYEGSPPVRTGPSIVDLGSGMWIAIAAMGALRERERTGQGCVVKLSLLETALAWVSQDISGYLNEDRVPGKRGNGQPLMAPYQAFDTSDSPIMIAVGKDSQFAEFAAALGHPEWAEDPMYATNGARLENKPVLIEKVAAILAGRPREHWLNSLIGRGVPCSEFNTIPEALSSEQIRALEFVRRSEETNTYITGLPFSIDGSRPGSARKAPDLGQDNRLLKQEK